MRESAIGRPFAQTKTCLVVVNAVNQRQLPSMAIMIVNIEGQEIFKSISQRRNQIKISRIRGQELLLLISVASNGIESDRIG